jgi:hypothetical protein
MARFFWSSLKQILNQACLPAGQVQDDKNKKQEVSSKKQVEKCKTALSFRTPVRNQLQNRS